MDNKSVGTVSSRRCDKHISSFFSYDRMRVEISRRADDAFSTQLTNNYVFLGFDVSATCADDRRDVMDATNLP